MANAENVVPLPQPAAEPKAAGEDRSPKARWTDRLGEPFCPVSSFFLANYHRLTPHPGARGLNSTEAMLVVQLIDHKWSKRAPWPTVKRLATRMGMSPRAVRESMHRLQELKYLNREYHPTGGPSRYHLDGLFKALERLMDEDQVKQDTAEAADAASGGEE